MSTRKELKNQALLSAIRSLEEEHYITDNIAELIIPIEGVDSLKAMLEKYFRVTNVDTVKIETYLNFRDYTNPKIKKLAINISESSRFFGFARLWDACQDYIEAFEENENENEINTKFIALQAEFLELGKRLQPSIGTINLKKIQRSVRQEIEAERNPAAQKRAPSCACLIL